MKKLLIYAAIFAALYFWFNSSTGKKVVTSAPKPNYNTPDQSDEASAKAKMIKLYGSNWEKVLSGKEAHPTTGLYFINGQWQKTPRTV